jgi:hypothetical protein
MGLLVPALHEMLSKHLMENFGGLNAESYYDENFDSMQAPVECSESGNSEFECDNREIYDSFIDLKSKRQLHTAEPNTMESCLKRQKI